ncbi:MAG: copper resistance protein B [Alphaproteobacteria bacterium]|nr:copper resistance protein B [Alphaproteobacteria bacterium]
MSAAPMVLVAAALLAVPAASAAGGMGDDPAPTLFHAIRAEFDYSPAHGGLFTWDVDGWIGGDAERVWLRSEGEVAAGRTESAEIQLYYGWNVATYWDVLAGVRQDIEPSGRTYLAASIVGLAPYFLDAEASAFLSDEGDLTGRLRQRFDLLLTNELIAEPYAELNLAAQDVPELGLGAGLTDMQLGLQLRYDVSRRFAPYVDAVWQEKLGETAGLARAAGEPAGQGSIRFGVRVLF